MLRRFAFGSLLCAVAALAGCTGTSDEGYGVPGEAAPIEAAPVETGGGDKTTIEIAPAQQLPAGGGRPMRPM